MLNSLEIEDSLKEIYRTDSLRYHRILLIYLNELSQYETTNRVNLIFREKFVKQKEKLRISF